MTELGAALTWDGGDDVYAAGKRDVATLCEYWCYLQLVRVITAVCGRTLDTEKLVRLDSRGIGVRLRTGRTPVLSATCSRRGRRVGVRLWFNERFARVGDPYGKGTWSRPMRPDCSIELSMLDADLDVDMGSTWLHFDAKCRVDDIQDLFGSRDEEVGGGGAKRDDLLKMHAYRDAIRRSVGAYVLFPGDRPEHDAVYQELLPGLGAFILRWRDGRVEGLSELTDFFEAALDHFADDATRLERSRYWTMQTYGRSRSAGTRPPDDTQVLVGYVRDPAHASWVESNRAYNLRADPARRGAVSANSDLLSTELVVLHDGSKVVRVWRASGRVDVATRDELLAMDYPRPGGSKYFLVRLEPSAVDIDSLTISDDVSTAPQATTLARLRR